MSYWTVAQIAADNDITQRESAAYAAETPAGADDPHLWALANGLRLAGQPGWDTAWESAIAAGVEGPGRDPGVITDGMILAAVQVMAGGH